MLLAVLGRSNPKFKAYKQHNLQKRQTVSGVLATTEVLCDLATTLTNTTEIIEEFSEVSTLSNLLNITLNGTSPDEGFVNDTLNSIDEGEFVFFYKRDNLLKTLNVFCFLTMVNCPLIEKLYCLELNVHWKIYHQQFARRTQRFAYLMNIACMMTIQVKFEIFQKHIYSFSKVRISLKQEDTFHYCRTEHFVEFGVLLSIQMC